MRILRCILMILAALPALLGAAEPGAAEIRVIRELQARNLGVPTLAVQAPGPEALLALAELGGSATAQGAAWTGNDQDALYALLQRYRDELLALGMDSAELEAQLERLQARTSEVERRLEALKPKDGLKFHAYTATGIDDLHVFGNGYIGKTASRETVPEKKAGDGMRTQLGFVRTVMSLDGTRGPLSGQIKLGLVYPWGNNFRGELVPLRAYVELRTPLAVQFGDVDAALSPLTLWRADAMDPYEPDLFRDREKRLRDDLLLAPDKWRLRGVRLSTDWTPFGALTLGLESTTAVMAYNSIGSGTQNVAYYKVAISNASPLASTTYNLVSHYNSYLEAWRAKAAFGDSKSVSLQGTFFWDDTSAISAYNLPAWSFTGMQSMVNSLSTDLGFGPVRLQAEAALSSYTAPHLTYAATPDPLTGTAFTASLGWRMEKAGIRVFGRAVSAGFHSAGAQGRTVDADWQYLGPFMTENSQLGADGQVGVFSPIAVASGANIPPGYASRLNDLLLPPGLARSTAVAAVPATWAHLLGYFPHEEIDPYGPATPNRAGFGVEADGAFFSKSLRPSAGYEAFSNAEAPVDGLGNSLAPFAMSRLRAGLDFDLAPLLGWPLAFGGGYTATTSSNGWQAPSGDAYSLNTTLLDASFVVGRGGPYGLAAGWRSLSDEGIHPLLFNVTGNKETWDLIGLGAWWRPQDGTSVDLVYSLGHTDVPANLKQGLTAEQLVLRLTTEF